MKIFQYVGVTGFFLCMPIFVLANSLGIAVDQTNVVFDIDSGKEQQFIIEVTNISDKEQEVVVGVQDYVLDNNNKLTLIEGRDDQNGIKDWIDIEDNSIILVPGESQDVLFTVKTSEDASIGSHRGVVLFRATSDADESVKVQGQIGIHVLINVRGDTHASGRVHSFDIPLLTFGLVDYDVEFENTGNIHYVPYGEVVVRNVFTHHEQMYKYDKHFVFPGKKFKFVVSDEIPSLFGLYSARVIFVDGEGAVREKMDYIMGYFAPLIFIVVIGVVISILYRLRKKERIIIKKHVIKKQKLAQDVLVKKKREALSEKEQKSSNALDEENIHSKKDSGTNHKVDVTTDDE